MVGDGKCQRQLEKIACILFVQTTNSRVQFIPILIFDLSYSHFKFMLYSDKHMHQCNLRGDTAIKMSTYALIHKAF